MKIETLKKLIADELGVSIFHPRYFEINKYQEKVFKLIDLYEADKEKTDIKLNTYYVPENPYKEEKNPFIVTYNNKKVCVDNGIYSGHWNMSLTIIPDGKNKKNT